MGVCGMLGVVFLPTPSRRGRQFYIALNLDCFAFLPTPSRRGRPAKKRGGKAMAAFLPTPSRRGRRCQGGDIDTIVRFLPTPSRRGRPGHGQGSVRKRDFYPRPRVEGDSKHAEVQACISAAYLKCSTRKAAASRRCAGLGGRAVLFHQLSRLVLGRARCELRGEGMCDRGSHRRSGRRAIVKAHSSRMSSWLH